jgi:hypothetical protein
MRVSLQITLVWVFFVECSRLLRWGWELRVRVRRRVDLRGCLPHGLKRKMKSAIGRLLDLRLLDSLKWGVSGVAVRGQLAFKCNGGKWGLKSARIRPSPTWDSVSSARWRQSPLLGRLWDRAIIPSPRARLLLDGGWTAPKHVVGTNPLHNALPIVGFNSSTCGSKRRLTTQAKTNLSNKA